MNGSIIAASVGCNRVVGCLDWGPNNLIAFGASNFVSIYDVKVRSIQINFPNNAAIEWKYCGNTKRTHGTNQLR